MNEWLSLWTILYLAFICAYGLLAGYGEGMTMIMDGDKMCSAMATEMTGYLFSGIREHKLFFLYHYLRLLEQLCLVLASIFATFLFRSFTIILIIGGLFLMWELFEVAYNLARYSKAITNHENVMGIWSLDHWLDIWCLHLIRILIGTVLIMIGFGAISCS